MANQNGWDSIGTTDEKKGNNGGTPQEDKLDFLATPEGETEIRVLDEAPYFYQGHWSVKGNGADSGNGNGCWIPYKGKDDLLEKANREFMQGVFKQADAKGLKNGSPERKKFLKDEGYEKQPYGKLKSKYIIHVIDRADGQIKLLDAGAGIFEALKELHAHKYHGDLRTYDVTIVRKGTGWNDTKYSVMACPQKTPLTEDEIKLYEEKKIDRVALKSGEGLTPEQCLFIAEGGLWSELPQEDAPTEKPVEGVTVEVSIPDEDGVTTVITSKEGALSDEELANVNF
ncbi:phosphoesterase [Bacillus toyonensis]|uniref:phosphoesterase n=1 Tax=Bacillus toyonensis TaxID=155322 RepID=UPI00124D7FB2|nr:phosphoesterase [Bacillus toyonensis]KAB2380207.1 phosphoesterase [Bacillus toyonensis]